MPYLCFVTLPLAGGAAACGSADLRFLVRRGGVAGCTSKGKTWNE